MATDKKKIINNNKYSLCAMNEMALKFNKIVVFFLASSHCF